MKKSVLLLFTFFILFPFILFAQQKPFDIEMGQKRVMEHIFSKPDSAKFYLDLMVRDMSKLPDTSIAKIYNNYGLYYSQVSKLDSAKIFFEKAIKKADKNPKNKAGTLINLANAYRNSSEYDISLKYLESALKIYESIDNEVGIAMVYGEMGSNYAYMLENSIAIDYFIKGIEILENTTEKKRLSVIKQKLANLYFKMKNYDFAIEMYEECLSSMKETKDMRNYYLTLINYGDCLIMVKEYSKAKKALLEAIDGLKVFQSNELIGLTYNKLGRVYLFEDDIDLTVKYNKKAFDYIIQTQSFRMMRIGTEYIEVLNLIGEYQKALEVIKSIEDFPNQVIFNIEDKMLFEAASAEIYKNTNLKDKAISSLENTIILKDSIASLSEEAIIKEIQAEFETEIQREKNIALKRRNELLTDKIKAQNKNYILLGIIIFILIVVIIAFVKIYGLRNKLQQLKIREYKIENNKMREVHQHELKQAESQKQILSLREQELTSITLQLADMQEQVASVIKISNDGASKSSETDDILRSLKNIIKQKDYWKEFSIKFSQIHPDFRNNLKVKYPFLTKNDINFLCLLKLNLSNKEIATLSRISHESVISKKYRIKKKLNIDQDAEFSKVISEL